MEDRMELSEWCRRGPAACRFTEAVLLQEYFFIRGIFRSYSASFKNITRCLVFIIN